jgi:hypothetical protein
MAFPERRSQRDAPGGHLFVDLWQAPLKADTNNPQLPGGGGKGKQERVWTFCVSWADKGHSGPRQYALLSEQSDACVIRSSDEVTLSSSMAVSSRRPLLCRKNSLRVPFVVTHRRALLDGLGCQGPEAG